MKTKIRQYIGIALLISIGVGMMGHFLGFNMTFAEDINQINLIQDLQSKLNDANIYMNIIYLLLWPGLILAGMSLDNNMVYGSFFNLDAPLWVIRNIIKNFANFALGFMVLVEVIKMIFNFGDHATEHVTKVIKNCIIAGVAIQASWFLLAATIDLSTVATYGIGGLPLSVLGTSQDASIQCLANKKILGVASKMDFTNNLQNGVTNQGFIYYYYIDAQGGRKNYSPCELKNNYVVGRQYGGPNTSNVPGNRNTGEVFTEAGYCILGADKVVHFNGEIAFDTLPPYQSIDPATMTRTQYEQSLLNWIPTITDTGSYTRSGLAQAQKIFDINATISFDVSDGFGIAPLYAIPNTAGREVFNDSGVLTMKNILEYSKGMMGPLITLYASILNFAQFNIQANTGGDRALVIDAIIKTLLALAMVIPLLLTALIMLVRVGILWIVIALSPFFVLKRSFHESLGEALHEIPILKYEIKDLVKIIFAPVVIVFAISLCIIFMSLLVNSFSNRGAANPCAPNTTQMYSDTFGIDEYIYSTGQVIKVGSLFEIGNQAFDSSTGGDARDYIGWIIVNLFGIGVVWMILMAALSFSKDLGEVVGVKKIGEWAANTVGSIPIIPVPTSNGLGLVGTNTFKKVSQAGLEKASQGMSLDSQFSKSFDEYVSGRESKEGNKNKEGTANTETLTNEQITKIDNAINSGTPLSQVRDNMIKENPTINQTIIDNHIVENIAKLAADDKKTFTDKASINKAVDNFKVAVKNMTTSQVENIYNNKESKFKHILAPKLANGESKNIKFNENTRGTISKSNDGDISVAPLNDDTIKTDPNKYSDIQQVLRKDVDTFVKDLEEQISKNPADKTKLEAIKSFYPTT